MKLCIKRLPGWPVTVIHMTVKWPWFLVVSIHPKLTMQVLGLHKGKKSQCRKVDREIELEIYIQIYTHVCIFATCQLKGLCFLPQKKQRTKELSRIFHSYNPYDHKVRAACYQCDWVIEVLLNVEHRVRQYTVIWKYTSTNYIYISVLIFNSLSLVKKRENLYF